MITVTFQRNEEGALREFTVRGHSGAGAKGEDIVCAAVSSASYLTANTLLEVLHLNAEAEVRDGYMRITLPPPSVEKAQVPLQGLSLHLKALREQYPENIKIITEV